MCRSAITQLEHCGRKIVCPDLPKIVKKKSVQLNKNKDVINGKEWQRYVKSTKYLLIEINNLLKIKIK